MELKQITENIYYIDSRINIGVIKNSSGDVMLIDTGIDDNAGKKILKTLEEESFNVKAILNTHSHADHFGGNSFIKERTGAKVYAPEIEVAIIHYPILEPLYLFSGAAPVSDLKNKFLMAPPCEVDSVIKGGDRITFGDLEIDVIPLPGHSPNQVGVGGDGVLFCADSIMSKDVFEKHKIPFNMDIDAQRETLEYLRNSEFDCYVPAHAEPVEDITELANAYLVDLDKIEGAVIEAINGSDTTEGILKKTADSFDFNMKNVQQYHLINTVVTAFLSSLYNRGEIKIKVKKNSLYWERGEGN